MDTAHKTDIWNQLERPWYFNLPIEELELTVRAHKDLTASGVHTLGDLCHHSPEKLCEIGKVGNKSMSEIEYKMTECGLAWADVGFAKATSALEIGFTHWSKNRELVQKYNPQGQTLDNVLNPMSTLSEFIDGTIIAVGNAPGGSVALNVDLNDPVWEYKIQELKNNGLSVQMTAFVSRSSDAPQPE